MTRHLNILGNVCTTNFVMVMMMTMVMMMKMMMVMFESNVNLSENPSKKAFLRVITYAITGYLKPKFRCKHFVHVSHKTFSFSQAEL